jgi:hypothetical protein
MDDPLPQFVASLNEAVKRWQVFLCITRDRDLQEQACAEIEAVRPTVAEEKEKAICQGNEDYANLLLGCECAAGALLAEIQMWIALKSEEPDKAWDELVAAQMATAGAVRAHRCFGHFV